MKTLLIIAFLVALVGLLTSLVVFFNLILTKNNSLLGDEKITVIRELEHLKK